MAKQHATRINERLRTVGFILPVIGVAAWVIGVGAPAVAWLTETPIYNRNTGQPDAVISLPTILFGLGSAMIGAVLIRAVRSDAPLGVAGALSHKGS